ncbi:MAG: DUF4394 domain-containing protein, partial [Archangium sp.]
VDPTEASAFDIVPVTAGGNAAFASLTVAGVTGLYSIDLATGTATLARAITGLNASESLLGVVQRNAVTPPAQAPGDFVGLNDMSQLVTFNAAAPQKLCTGPVALTGVTGFVVGMDVRPATGALYVLNGNGNLYTVNIATGAATLASTLAADAADMTLPFTTLNGADFSIDFNPTVDRLRILSNTSQNLRVNVDTGATTTDDALTIGGGAGTGVTSAAYTNSFGGALETTIYAIDSMTDSLLTSAAPNAGAYTVVGPLTVSLTNVTSFEIAGQSNIAYVAAEVTGTPDVSSLFTVNLATGAATRVNTIGGGRKLVGFTSRVAQRAEVVGVTQSNRVVTFSPPTPATLTNDVAITGLATSENVVGVDFRPATGQLVALTNQNRLYVIDTTTGAASSALVMAADATDNTDAFTTLQGFVFGIDFNPTVDRLRVVSTITAAGIPPFTRGENLRVNPTTGAVITDGRFEPVLQNIDLFAAAYTNSFAGASTTTLYYADSESDSLLSTTAPNNGTTTTVGSFGGSINVDNIGDFDIAGQANNLALGAFHVAAQTNSHLYRVNLTTGALTDVGAINIASPVVGMSIRFR